MPKVRLRVAVIGAGASGITAVKCCLEEGLEPVCFERSSYIGGLWHYSDDVIEGQGSVMKSTEINTSKEMMCYSDYPVPTDFSIFMHNTKVDQYLNMYADNFGVRKYIHLNTEVMSVKPKDPSACQWTVVTKSNGSESQTHVFDAVMICTGHLADKNMPNFPGQEKFRGNIVHTHDYKHFKGYEDKRVLIIGIGNSGGDVATVLSRISKQVYLSTRTGSWILNRMADDGNPLDMQLTTRFISSMRKMFPNMAKNAIQRRLNKKFNHANFCLQPEFDISGAHPTVNDELPNRIISGSVIVKANVYEFTETGAIFEDGTNVEDLDVVIFATGYVFGFPFLDKSVTEVKDNVVNLYKFIFPPDLQTSSLAVIGCIQPSGAVFPVSEMQSRLATRVFKGDAKLPDRDGMWSDIRQKRTAMSKRYKKSTRHKIQAHYIDYMDRLAEMIGCKPNIGQLLWMDPKLGVKCFFGPVTPYQFRLMGPVSWAGARTAIMTQWDRTYLALKTRPCGVSRDAIQPGKWVILMVVAITCVIYLSLTNSKRSIV